MIGRQCCCNCRRYPAPARCCYPPLFPLSLSSLFTPLSSTAAAMAAAAAAAAADAAAIPAEVVAAAAAAVPVGADGSMLSDMKVWRMVVLWQGWVCVRAWGCHSPSLTPLHHPLTQPQHTRPHTHTAQRKELAGELPIEPMLAENKHRFVLFPIKYDRVREAGERGGGERRSDSPGGRLVVTRHTHARAARRRGVTGSCVGCRVVGGGRAARGWWWWWTSLQLAGRQRLVHQRYPARATAACVWSNVCFVAV